MFDRHSITDNKRRSSEPREEPSDKEIYEGRPGERPMPYLSIVPQNMDADEQFQSLDSISKGLFLLLVVTVLWPGNGYCVRLSGHIAKRMGLMLTEWEALERKLLNSGLLEVSPDGYSLVSKALRRQYLLTLQASKNKGKRKKGNMVT